MITRTFGKKAPCIFYAVVSCLSISACAVAETSVSSAQENDTLTALRYIPIGGGLDYEWGKDHIFVKLSRAETGGALTLIQDNMKPGFDLRMHLHRIHTEIFYILDGEVVFETLEETFRATKGSVVYLPAGAPHAANSSTGGQMLMFYTPGGFDDMLAEIENASWFQRINPLERRRRDARYDFIKVSAGADPEPDAPKPIFLDGSEVQDFPPTTDSSVAKLTSENTDGLAIVTEDTLAAGSQRVSSRPEGWIEVVYVLEGEVEATAQNQVQTAEAGATLYFPAGVEAQLSTPNGSRFLVYQMPSEPKS